MTDESISTGPISRGPSSRGPSSRGPISRGSSTGKPDGVLPKDVLPQDATDLLDRLSAYGHTLISPGEGQYLVRVTEGRLPDLARYLSAGGFRLLTVTGNDERELEDRCFKIYYVVERDGATVHAEYLLPRGSVEYESLRSVFPAVEPFEHHLVDLLGLYPSGVPVRAGSLLHERFPAGLYPLRRDRTLAELRALTRAEPPERSPDPDPVTRPGHVAMAVGPVHAGVIGSGRFLFHLDGETIEDVEIGLGYTHRGLERIFASHLHLLDGWRMAQQAAGDASVAHALACCRAAEALTAGAVPPAGALVREVLLELELVHNHVAALAALAEDVALLRPAARLARARERLLQANETLTGHRYLRGAVRPGGVSLPEPLDGDALLTRLRPLVRDVLDVARALLARPGFRARTQGVGVLTQAEVHRLGATGLVARASTGDSREEASAGDVHARSAVRVLEIDEAWQRVETLLGQWARADGAWRADVRGRLHVLPDNNYTFALGRARSFRGDVVYWIMQDKLDGVFRCKITDPSTVNWPALRQALLPRQVPWPRRDGGVGTRQLETALADFPLVNKSFNLSYAGNDL